MRLLTAWRGHKERANNSKQAIAVDRMANRLLVKGLATFAVSLCSAAASHVTGQIFGVRGNEVVVFDQPRPVRSVSRIDGWTPETLIEHGLPALKGGFMGLEATAGVFTWDPV